MIRAPGPSSKRSATDGRESGTLSQGEHPSVGQTSGFGNHQMEETVSFDEGQHPRVPAGSPHGGEFASKGGGFSLSGPFVPGVSGIDLGIYKDRDVAIRKLTKEDGKELGVMDLARLAGALPGSRLADIEIDSGVVGVSVHFLDEKKNIIAGNSRALYLTSETIYNSSMHIDKDHQRKGIGTKMLVQQVNAAVEHGFKKIDVFAAGEPGGKSNGYYTWPALGFLPRSSRNAFTGEDMPGSIGKLGISVINAAKTAHVPRIIDMARMMSTKKGRDWWQKNGEAHSGTFDLREGSISRRVLSAYAKAKGWS